MTTALAALSMLAATLAWPAPRHPGGRLRRALAPAPGSACGQGQPGGPRRPLVAAAALAVGAMILSGVPAWAVLPIVLAGLVAARRRTRGSDVDELPLVLDLVASCLSAGATPADAWKAAGTATGGRLQARIDAVVAALRSGLPPAAAWAPWLADAHLAPAGRTCVRTAHSGAAAAAELTRLAGRLRAQRHVAAQQRAARASVWVVLPLGLCFLPAFVLVGVVPLAVGLVQQLR